MVRVAAYCRVSTDREDQANSFESQQRYFLACIRRNPDWELQGIYADEGITGTSTRRRTQFNAMIAAARAGQIDLIVTKEVSRFARNTLDALAYTRQLRRRGIGVLFLIDNIDTRQQDGELRLSILSSIAQEESRKTSQRVKWGQTRRMEQGVVFGGPLLGYDLDRGQLRVNPEGAETVRLIFRKYLDERKGTRVIARELREAMIPSSRGNLAWSAATVLKILKNEKYCGDLVQKKTYTPDYLTHEKKYNRGQERLVVLRDHHTPIVSRETWEAAQRELARRRRGGGSEQHGSGNRHALSGKIRCGQCGSCFLSRAKKTRAGTPYRVWRCGRAAAHGAAGDGGPGCGVGRQLRQDDALELLRAAVAQVPLDREAAVRRLTGTVEAVLRESREGRLVQLEAERDREVRARQRALDAYLRGTVTEADFRLADQRCRERAAALEEDLAQARRQAAPQAEREGALQAAVERLVRGESADEAFWADLLDHMTVRSDGGVEVVLEGLPARWTFQTGG